VHYIRSASTATLHSFAHHRETAILLPACQHIPRAPPPATSVVCPDVERRLTGPALTAAL
jgi:hypothetical protein